MIKEQTNDREIIIFLLATIDNITTVAHRMNNNPQAMLNVIDALENSAYKIAEEGGYSIPNS